MLFLFLSLALAQPTASGASSSEGQPTIAPDYVRNRLSPERIDALVARPQALLEVGDLEGARRLLDQLLTRTRARHGDNSVEAADLLMAFGVILHIQGDYDEDPELRALAGTYVKRSIPVYRAAFGADHPEVAVALNSHADILRIAAPDDPPPAAEEALEEAYRIRLAALGSGHPETLWTRLYLADVRAAPARVRANPALVDAVVADLARAAQEARISRIEGGAETGLDIELRRARLYARNGRADGAREALEAMDHALSGLDAPLRCYALAAASEEVDELLTAAGGTPLRFRDFTTCPVEFFEPDS